MNTCILVVYDNGYTEINRAWSDESHAFDRVVVYRNLKDAVSDQIRFTRFGLVGRTYEVIPEEVAKLHPDWSGRREVV